MDVSVGSLIRLSTKELMLLNCVLQFMGLQRVGHDWATDLNWTELDCKEIKPANPKGSQPWIFIGRTDAEVEAPILWPPDAKSWLIRKDPYGGKRLKAWGKGDNRGWDGWMASPTQWTWVWANFGRQWRTGKTGVLQSTGSQTVTHDLATEQQQ